LKMILSKKISKKSGGNNYYNSPVNSTANYFYPAWNIVFSG